MKHFYICLLPLAAVLALMGSPVAESDHDHGHNDHADHRAMMGGAPGEAAKAKRTVELIALDTEFKPKTIRVAAGETVRFVIRNKGELLHEFTIGGKEMHAVHQQEMERLMLQGVITTIGIDRAKLGSAGHSHGNSVLVEPGKSVELVWKFAKAADIEFACNIPGHYQSGMRGAIEIQ